MSECLMKSQLSIFQRHNKKQCQAEYNNSFLEYDNLTDSLNLRKFSL